MLSFCYGCTIQFLPSNRASFGRVGFFDGLPACHFSENLAACAHPEPQPRERFPASTQHSTAYSRTVSRPSVASQPWKQRLQNCFSHSSALHSNFLPRFFRVVLCGEQRLGQALLLWTQRGRSEKVKECKNSTDRRSSRGAFLSGIFFCLGVCFAHFLGVLLWCGRATDKSTKTVKVLLVGDPGVGKSSVITRFTENKFEDQPPDFDCVCLRQHFTTATARAPHSAHVGE